MGTHLLSNPRREGRQVDDGSPGFGGVEIAAPFEIVDSGAAETLAFALRACGLLDSRFRPALGAGGLIQTASGTAGGSGGRWTKRSGWAAYAVARISPARPGLLPVKERRCSPRPRSSNSTPSSSPPWPRCSDYVSSADTACRWHVPPESSRIT